MGVRELEGDISWIGDEMGEGDCKTGARLKSTLVKLA